MSGDRDLLMKCFVDQDGEGVSLQFGKPFNWVFTLPIDIAKELASSLIRAAQEAERQFPPAVVIYVAANSPEGSPAA